MQKENNDDHNKKHPTTSIKGTKKANLGAALRKNLLRRKKLSKKI